MRAPVRSLIVLATFLVAGCGEAETDVSAPRRPATPTADAADINREAKAPALVYVYKTQGDDPMPWTLTVRTDNTANLIVGGGHTGGTDKVVILEPATTQRASQLVAAVPWKRIQGHTVEPGGFGGNDNMARYVLRRGKVTTVYAGGDMPRSVTRLVGLLDRIIEGDIGKAVASDSHHSSNGGVLTDP
jgi:hypothetical protein